MAHCETVTLLGDKRRCLLDLGPDHLPSPSGFLRLLDGTRLRRLTVKLDDLDRWGSGIIVSLVTHWAAVMDVSTAGLSPVPVESLGATRNQRL